MRSSRAISAADRDVIRTVIGPLVSTARKRMHSPEPAPQTARIASVLHTSKVLARTFLPTSRRQRVRALRPNRGEHARARCLDRPCGKYRLRFNAADTLVRMWAGPVLLEATADTWRVVDVTAPFHRAVIHYTDDTAMPCVHVAVFNNSGTFDPPPRQGNVTAWEVQPLRACFRKATDVHAEIVRHWEPFTRLIYAKCHDEAASRVYARIDAANRIHCLYCTQNIADVHALCRHLHVPPNTQFRTDYTGTHHGQLQLP